jgi:hypothetical protein
VSELFDEFLKALEEYQVGQFGMGEIPVDPYSRSYWQDEYREKEGEARTELMSKFIKAVQWAMTIEVKE